MSAPIDESQASSIADARAGSDLDSILATPGDALLLDALRRRATVSVRRIRDDFVEVHTPHHVLGYVRHERHGFTALRGDDPAWATPIGSYASESLAIEALRMRRG
ncbi:hypothetical protein [Curtobacterium ammoniigenes]|uniref:hypothetical protein n=1 Tax=Curtobacterium ammoniigenes TaxID=395387 RepID=UPI00082D8D9C|nr:hypothetical protein [Curtobacterium ammoniigenes]